VLHERQNLELDMVFHTPLICNRLQFTETHRHRPPTL